MRYGKLVIAEGAGPTAVINQSLVGAVLETRLFPQIEGIYGACYGVREEATLRRQLVAPTLASR
jgi:ATP-dependent phosphofructokinase / diphosphate-dependent phosphofructokinase